MLFLYLVVRDYKRKTQEVPRESVIRAIRAVQDGISQREAAEAYAVPRTTLQNYLKKGIEAVPAEIRSGRFRTVFNHAQEEELVDYVIELSNM